MSTASPIIITVARQLGSGGSYLGREVAAALGYAYIDRQILQQAAKELGCAEADIAHREERIQGFWSRMLRVFSFGPPEEIYSPPPLHSIPDERILDVERRILGELCCKGSCVVVGHGGFHLLRGRGWLINVFVHAPRAFRIDRVIRLYHAADSAEAERMIDEADAQRERYIEERTGRSWYDARNYHLTLDIARMGFEAATALIVDMARRLEESQQPPSDVSSSSEGPTET